MTGVYPNLAFPAAQADRPAIVTNMVATLDGKTVSGTRSDAVGDLGSPLDHATMRQIEGASQAVILGNGSLRATPGLWYAAGLIRFVVTGSGDVNPFCRFFTDSPPEAFVVTSNLGAKRLHPDLQAIVVGEELVDLGEALRVMRQEFGLERLLVEGGSELNAEFFRLDLVDEAFLTLSPKIKLGRGVPTYAGGDPLPRTGLLRFQLVSCSPQGDEVFLRYRRVRTA